MSIGGSGGGGYFNDRTPDRVRSDLRKETERTRDQAFDIEIAEAIGQLLAEANDRDTDAVSRAFEDIKRVLEHHMEGSVETRFGSSVRKHILVDGISDVDTLFILHDPSLKTSSPREALDFFEQMLRKELPACEVSRGKIAITLRRIWRGNCVAAISLISCLNLPSYAKQPG